MGPIRRIDVTKATRPAPPGNTNDIGWWLGVLEDHIAEATQIIRTELTRLAPLGPEKVAKALERIRVGALSPFVERELFRAAFTQDHVCEFQDEVVIEFMRRVFGVDLSQRFALEHARMED